MDVDTKKLLRDISCGLDQLTMAVKELVHLMKPSIKDVGYAQHMERERQRLHSPVANSQMEQTGQGWAEPPEDEEDAADVKWSSLEDGVGEVVGFVAEEEPEWVIDLREAGKIADGSGDWRQDNRDRLIREATDLGLHYGRCDAWSEVAEMIINHRRQQAQRESTRPSTHTKESETGRKRKPLDSSYTRYCSVCEVNRIHKHNTEGVCPDCAALERNARNAKNLEEQQGSGI